MTKTKKLSAFLLSASLIFTSTISLKASLKTPQDVWEYVRINEPILAGPFLSIDASVELLKELYAKFLDRQNNEKLSIHVARMKQIEELFSKKRVEICLICEQNDLNEQRRTILKEILITEQEFQKNLVVPVLQLFAKYLAFPGRPNIIDVKKDLDPIVNYLKSESTAQFIDAQLAIIQTSLVQLGHTELAQHIQELRTTIARVLVEFRNSSASADMLTLLNSRVRNK